MACPAGGRQSQLGDYVVLPKSLIFSLRLCCAGWTWAPTGAMGGLREAFCRNRQRIFTDRSVCPNPEGFRGPSQVLKKDVEKLAQRIPGRERGNGQMWRRWQKAQVQGGTSGAEWLLHTTRVRCDQSGR